MSPESKDEIQHRLLKTEIMLEIEREFDIREKKIKDAIPNIKNELPSGFWWAAGPIIGIICAFFWFNINSVNSLSKQFSNMRIDIVKLEQKVESTKRVSNKLYKRVAPQYGLEPLAKLNKSISNDIRNITNK